MSKPKIAMLLPGLLLVFTLAGCSNNSWRQFRNDANHSGQNSMSLLQPANVAAMVPSMVYNSNYTYIFNSQIVVDQLNTILNPFPPHNTLLFADGGSDLIAWDPDKNVAAWPPFSLSSGSINSTPAVDDTRYVVYAMDADKLYAIDELKGTLLWYGAVRNHTYPTFQGPSPTIYNGFVYAPSSDGHVYKFDPTKCTNNQKQCAAVWQSQDVGATYQGFYTSPSIITTTKGKVYVIIATFMNSTTQETFAFNDGDGSEAWGTPEFAGILRFSGSTVASPAVLNNTVFIGSALPAFPGIGSLRAYDADTGKACWDPGTLPIFGEINSSPALVTENGQPVAYLGSSHGLQKVDARCSGGGGVLWAGSVGGPVGFSSPAVANVGGNEIIFVGTTNNGQGQLEAYDMTGKDLNLSGLFGDNSAVQTGPTVFGTSVYTTDQDGNIYLFR